MKPADPQYPDGWIKDPREIIGRESWIYPFEFIEGWGG